MKKRAIWSLLACLLCLSFTLSACGGGEEKTVVLGYDNTAEEAILAGMLTELIETNTDITVEVIGDLAGGETVLHPAITSGEIDMYPE